MDSNPYESPASANEAAIRSGSSGKRLFFTMLALLGGMGLLVLLMLPALRIAPEAGRRAHCTNNMKQITLGLLNYQSRYQAFPPAYTVDENGKPLHSWRTLLLPYIEQTPLYERIDLTKPWNDPANANVFETPVAVYTCPTSRLVRGYTTYLAVVGQDVCLLPTESRKLSDITDDHAKTLMVIEVDKEHSVPWMAPTDADEKMILSLMSSDSFPHPGGMNAVFVDGHGAFLQTDTEAKNLRAMISIAGHDDDETFEED